MSTGRWAGRPIAGNSGSSAADRHEVAGLGLGHRQAAVFQHPIRLLHRAQADPVFHAQGPYRGQPVAGAIEALFDTRASNSARLT